MVSLLILVCRFHRHVPIRVYDEVAIGVDGAPVMLWHLECRECGHPFEENA